jgi:F-type H+-transporting ATPase subunit b
MLIDWFTVGAQALNFVVLVWLLKRFLYQPVLDAIAIRERRIAQQIADATALKLDAQAQRLAFDQKSQAFDLERAGLLDAATQEAEAERARLMAIARKAADEVAAKRQEAIHNEAVQWQQSLAEGTRREVFEITRRVLADLATADLEERLAQVFVRRLTELDGPARDRLCAALTAPGAHAVVRSASALPWPARTAIEVAVKSCGVTDAVIEFTTAPDLVCGIELICAGEKLAWSIDQYLGTLERTVADLMTPPAAAAASTGSR